MFCLGFISEWAMRLRHSRLSLEEKWQKPADSTSYETTQRAATCRTVPPGITIFIALDTPVAAESKVMLCTPLIHQPHSTFTITAVINLSIILSSIMYCRIKGRLCQINSFLCASMCTSQTERTSATLQIKKHPRTQQTNIVE